MSLCTSLRTHLRVDPLGGQHPANSRLVLGDLPEVFWGHSTALGLSGAASDYGQDSRTCGGSTQSFSYIRKYGQSQYALTGTRLICCSTSISRHLSYRAIIRSCVQRCIGTMGSGHRTSSKIGQLILQGWGCRLSPTLPLFWPPVPVCRGAD